VDLKVRWLYPRASRVPTDDLLLGGHLGFEDSRVRVLWFYGSRVPGF